MANINRGGRPKNNGVQPGWMFLRATIGLLAYNQAKSAGVGKYDEALSAAATAINKEFPTMKASASLIKKILAEYQPENGEEALIVTKITDPNNPQFSPTRNTYGIGFGPRPIYVRYNHPK